MLCSHTLSGYWVLVIFVVLYTIYLLCLTIFVLTNSDVSVVGSSIVEVFCLYLVMDASASCWMVQASTQSKYNRLNKSSVQGQSLCCIWIWLSLNMISVSIASMFFCQRLFSFNYCAALQMINNLFKNCHNINILAFRVNH